MSATTVNRIYKIGSPTVKLAAELKVANGIAGSSAEILKGAKAFKAVSGKNDLLSNSGKEVGRRIEAIKRFSSGCVLVPGETVDLSTEAVLKHPKPAASFNVPTMYSYLNRYTSELEEFNKHILPLIVQQKLEQGDRNLKIAVIRPGFDENTSVLASILEAFGDNPEWGDINDWEIFVDGYENNLAVLIESMERINGRSPVGVLTKSRRRKASLPHQVELLNENLAWTSVRLTGFYADFASEETSNFLREMGYDAVYMNATFHDLSEYSPESQAGLIGEGDTFFIGDPYREGPIPHLTGTHWVENRIPDNRHETDFAIAVPNSFRPLWDLNSTGRLDNADVDLGNRPRLRILLITDKPENKAEFWLRENIGCWSSHHNLSYAEFTVTNSIDIASSKEIRNRMGHKYYSLAIVDSDEFKSGKHRNVSSFIFYEIDSPALYGIPTVVVDNEAGVEKEEYESFNIIPRQAIISDEEGQLTEVLDKAARKKKILVDGDAEVQAQVSDSLSNLAMFARDNHLGRLDRVLGSSYHLEKTGELISRFVVRGTEEKTTRHHSKFMEDDSRLEESLTKFESDLAEVDDQMASPLRKFSEALKPALEQVVEEADDSSPKWHLAYHLKDISKKYRLLSLFNQELDFCLEEPVDDVRTFLHLYVSGCGWAKHRDEYMVYDLVRTNKYVVGELQKQKFQSTDEEESRANLGNAYNGVIEAELALRKQIVSKMRKLAKYVNEGNLPPDTDKEKKGGCGTGSC